MIFGEEEGSKRDGVTTADIDKANLKLLKSRSMFYSIWSIVAMCLLVVGACFLLRIISLPVSVCIWTIIIVFCLRGVVNGLEKKGISRLLGAAIAYVLMFAVLALVLLLMFSPMFGVGDQFASLLSSLPSYVDGIFGWVNAMYERYSSVLSNETIHGYITALASAAGGWATSLAADSASSVFAFGTGAVNLVIAIAFALVVAFWILLELPRMGAECMRLAGPKHEETFTMLHLTFTRVLGGYIKGMLLQCTVIGVLSWLLFLVLGIPNAAALGVISGIMNIIPVVGPWLGGALAALVGIFVSPLVAVVAFVGSGVIQHGVYNLLYPIIMRNTVDIHPVLILLSIIIASAIGGAASGGISGGVVGMLIAVPVVAVAKSIFVYFFEKRTGRRIVSDDGVFFKSSSAEDADTFDPMNDAVSLNSTKPLGSNLEDDARRLRTERAIAVAKARLAHSDKVDKETSKQGSSQVIIQKSDTVTTDDAERIMLDRDGDGRPDELLSETHVVNTTVVDRVDVAQLEKELPKEEE